MKIQPVPINHVVVAKAAETRKRRPVLCEVDTKSKLPRVTETDRQTLKNLKGTPLEYMVSSDLPIISCPLGEVQLGSLLSYQTKNFKISQFNTADSAGCGDVQFPKPAPVKLPGDFKFLNYGYEVNSSELELKTRGQSNNAIWRVERSTRLTASNFGKVFKRNTSSAPSQSFMNSIFGQTIVNAPSLDYGRKHEAEAKAKFLSLNKSMHLHECGLMVNNEFPYLGASPDGILCDGGKVGIIEIKCPYAARNSTIEEACTGVKDFALSKENNTISLKGNHMYYSQVQGQLLISGADYCEFIVFTQKDIHQERIEPDISYMTEMLKRLSLFFMEYAIPYFAHQQTKSEST